MSVLSADVLADGAGRLFVEELTLSEDDVDLLAVQGIPAPLIAKTNLARRAQGLIQLYFTCLLDPDLKYDVVIALGAESDSPPFDHDDQEASGEKKGCNVQEAVVDSLEHGSSYPHNITETKDCQGDKLELFRATVVYCGHYE